MHGMFAGASRFNQEVGLWSTARVTDMSWMFQRARAFNQAIGSWNTGKVIDMQGMFAGAAEFNQKIGCLLYTSDAADDTPCVDL
eukprot:5158959-Amphidinium_carterae.1